MTALFGHFQRRRFAYATITSGNQGYPSFDS
jgi:hypothetical protein